MLAPSPPSLDAAPAGCLWWIVVMVSLGDLLFYIGALLQSLSLLRLLNSFVDFVVVMPRKQEA
jgi:hypothetical protein